MSTYFNYDELMDHQPPIEEPPRKLYAENVTYIFPYMLAVHKKADAFGLLPPSNDRDRFVAPKCPYCTYLVGKGIEYNVAFEMRFGVMHMMVQCPNCRASGPSIVLNSAVIQAYITSLVSKGILKEVMQTDQYNENMYDLAKIMGDINGALGILHAYTREHSFDGGEKSYYRSGLWLPYAIVVNEWYSLINPNVTYGKIKTERKKMVGTGFVPRPASGTID